MAAQYPVLSRDFRIKWENGKTVIDNWLASPPTPVVGIAYGLSDDAVPNLVPFGTISGKTVSLDPLLANAQDIFGLVARVDQCLIVDKGMTVKVPKDHRVFCFDGTGYGDFQGRAGRLYAVGTPSEPITFTLLEDLPAPNMWDGIQIGVDFTMDFCTVEKAGFQGFSIRGVHDGGGGQGVITLGTDAWVVNSDIDNFHIGITDIPTPSERTTWHIYNNEIEIMRLDSYNSETDSNVLNIKNNYINDELFEEFSPTVHRKQHVRNNSVKSYKVSPAMCNRADFTYNGSCVAGSPNWANALVGPLSERQNYTGNFPYDTEASPPFPRENNGWIQDTDTVVDMGIGGFPSQPASPPLVGDSITCSVMGNGFIIFISNIEFKQLSTFWNGFKADVADPNVKSYEVVEDAANSGAKITLELVSTDNLKIRNMLKTNMASFMFGKTLEGNVRIAFMVVGFRPLAAPTDPVIKRKEFCFFDFERALL